MSLTTNNICPLGHSPKAQSVYKAGQLYHLPFITVRGRNMRVGLGFLLLSLSLRGSGAQGGLTKASEITEVQKAPPRDAAEELTQQTLRQTTPDIWAEVRALRDMVVELRVELRIMTERMKESRSHVDDLKSQLLVNKGHMEQLQRENSGTGRLLYLLISLPEMFQYTY